MQIGMTCQQARDVGRIAEAAGDDLMVTIAWKLGGSLEITVTPLGVRTAQDCEQHTIPCAGTRGRLGR